MIDIINLFTDAQENVGEEEDPTTADAVLHLTSGVRLRGKVCMDPQSTSTVILWPTIREMPTFDEVMIYRAETTGDLKGEGRHSEFSEFVRLDFIERIGWAVTELDGGQ